MAITFPLVFGWIHFGSAADDQMTYVIYLFGFPVSSFRIRTVVSWLLFHGLDISAVLVLAGIALSLWRRMRDRGALALQIFARDFLPLHHAVRHLRHRPGADRLHIMAARLILWFPRDSARHHRHRGACCICRSGSSSTSFSDPRRSA